MDMTLEYSTALKSRLPDNHQARYTARLCVASAYTQNFMLDSTFLGKAVTEYTNFIGDVQKEERNLIFSGFSGGTPNGSILSDIVKRRMLATATDLLAEICERGGSYAAAVKLYQEALDLTAMDSECANLEVKLGRAKNRMVDNGRPGLGYIAYLRDRILVIERTEGENCADALIAKERLGTALLEQDEVEEAHRLVTATLSVFQRLFGPDNLRTKDFEMLVGQVAAKGEKMCLRSAKRAEDGNSLEISTDLEVAGAAAMVSEVTIEDNNIEAGRSRSNAAENRETQGRAEIVIRRKEGVVESRRAGTRRIVSHRCHDYEYN